MNIKYYCNNVAIYWGNILSQFQKIGIKQEEKFYWNSRQIGVKFFPNIKYNIFLFFLQQIAAPRRRPFLYYFIIFIDNLLIKTIIKEIFLIKSGTLFPAIAKFGQKYYLINNIAIMWQFIGEE